MRDQVVVEVQGIRRDGSYSFNSLLRDQCVFGVGRREYRREFLSIPSCGISYLGRPPRNRLLRKTHLSIPSCGISSTIILRRHGKTPQSFQFPLAGSVFSFSQAHTRLAFFQFPLAGSEHIILLASGRMGLWLSIPSCGIRPLRYQLNAEYTPNLPFQFPLAGSVPR